MRILSSIVAVIAAVSAATGTAAARDVPMPGGGGGQPFRYECLSGQFIQGFSGDVGVWIDRLVPWCVRETTSGPYKDTNDTVTAGPQYGTAKADARGNTWQYGSAQTLCPTNAAVVGIDVGYTIDQDHRIQFLQNVSLRCVLIGRPDVGVPPHTDGMTIHHFADGNTKFSAACNPGEFVTGITGRAGDALDAIGIICNLPPPPPPPPPPKPGNWPRLGSLVPCGDPAYAFNPSNANCPGNAPAPVRGPRIAGSARLAAQLAPLPSGITDVRGSWHTSEGDVVFSQHNAHVDGSYRQGQGRLSGEMNGKTFDGIWSEPSAAQRCQTAPLGSYYWGHVRFGFNAQTNHFEGAYSRCDAIAQGGSSWTGDLAK